MSDQYAYLFMEVALLTSVLVLTFDWFPLKLLMQKRFLFRMLALFFLWCVVDLTAVYVGAWHFDVKGTLPYRILGLPLEEYLLFPLHTLACFLISNYFHRRREEG